MASAPDTLLVDVDGVQRVAQEFALRPMGEAMARILQEARSTGRIPARAPADLSEDGKACFERLMQKIQIAGPEVGS